MDVKAQGSVTRKKCFVLSPIGQKGSAERIAADKVYKHLIRKSLTPDFEISRADESLNPGAISPTIIASILEADLVVADISGANPNVFYELAIAHGYNKPTVHLQRSSEEIPFDVKDIRIVSYDIADLDDVEEAQKLLKEYANFAMQNPDGMETPLTSARRFIDIEGSTDPVAESNVRVMQAIDELSLEVKKVIRGRNGITRAVRLQTGRAKADMASLQEIVDRVVESERALPADFDSVITQETSAGFDEWVRALFIAAFPGEDTTTANIVLFSPDVEPEDEGDYEPDEDEPRGR